MQKDNGIDDQVFLTSLRNIPITSNKVASLQQKQSLKRYVYPVYSSHMSTFLDLINGDKPVLVDFFATWCGPCKTQAPILDDVKKRVGDAATIIKIDVDKNPPAAARYQVRGVPTLILFKNGQIKWRQSGVFPANELERLIRENG